MRAYGYTASITKIKSIDWNDSRPAAIIARRSGASGSPAFFSRSHLTREAVQSAVRIAATVHAVARVLESSGEQLGRAAAA
jgi:hypothetical protein